MMGSFNGALWSDVFRTVPVMAVAAAGIFMLRRPLQILLLGDDEAASLGVSVGIGPPYGGCICDAPCLRCNSMLRGWWLGSD